MRWIDFDGRTPTDIDIPGWKPWTKDRWDRWLAESQRLLNELSNLHNAGKIKERNALIDNNRAHWDKLKPWLRALSYGKCWFTESRDNASHLEVEHFRPKKIAKDLDGNERDGYWWLAFEYTNYRLAGNVPNRKKGGWFPLHTSSRFSTHNARCEESETYCLLDPTKQTDVMLLAFNEEGNAGPAVPPGKIDPWELKRVDESVKRLKLNEHDALPEARRRVWQEVSRTIRLYRKAKLTKGPVNPAVTSAIEEHARSIRKMTRPDAELSSVAVWCVSFHADHEDDRDLLKLLNF